MSRTQQEDVREFARTFALADELANASFLITGATGLIGTSLIRCLLALDKGIRIIAPVRNKEKAMAMFGDVFDRVEWMECDLASCDYDQVGKVDYVIHCAAPTSSKFFVDSPVETIRVIYEATATLLNFAYRQSIKGFVYLSSLEVYGSGLPDIKITEDMQGYWDVMNIRSSYPVAKRAVENLCCAYASEYGVPVKIARLTQTTGSGMVKDDNRVVAQFARLAAKGEDIVLHTTGESARPYCYTTDCISALLYILLKGKNGEAYNVANDSTYISARGMAEFLRDNFNPAIDVRVELNDNMGYAPASKLNLSTEKLRALGWQPRYDLKQLFERLITYLSE
ncbi:MAG: NAD(P)-dependent oxidoreductase [Bacteroidales bacterium]|nr:NAD(P)-dependent oxidoreductase [Bacteroidales bacterium]